MAKFHNNVLVEKALEKYPRARADDKFLILVVWDMCGFKLTESQMRLFLGNTVPSTESIRRTRQKLQEDGKYLPPKAVQEARAKLEDETRHEVVGHNYTETPKPIQERLV